jgi:hypothetical protein
MLTSYQVEHIAFSTPYGEFWCTDCTHDALDMGGGGDVEGFEPVTRFELDEWQSQTSYDDRIDADPDDHVEDCECLWAVHCDSCGTELVEEYVDTRCQDKQEGEV